MRNEEFDIPNLTRPTSEIDCLAADMTNELAADAAADGGMFPATQRKKNALYQAKRARNALKVLHLRRQELFAPCHIATIIKRSSYNSQIFKSSVRTNM